MCNCSQWYTDNRANADCEVKPAKTDEEAESPQTKKRKQEERDLSFLRVKNKDGQDCLFVDLGKTNFKLVFFLFLPLDKCSYIA